MAVILNIEYLTCKRYTAGQTQFFIAEQIFMFFFFFKQMENPRLDREKVTTEYIYYGEYEIQYHVHATRYYIYIW